MITLLLQHNATARSRTSRGFLPEAILHPFIQGRSLQQTWGGSNPGATIAQIARALALDARDPQGRDPLRPDLPHPTPTRRAASAPKADNYRYRLHDIRLDCDEFYRYVNRAQACIALHAATDLEQVLGYVGGSPFDDAHGRYAWALVGAEAFRRDILTACHALAELYLEAHQPRRTWYAARKALSLDELHSAANKDLFSALHALGETAGKIGSQPTPRLEGDHRLRRRDGQGMSLHG